MAELKPCPFCEGRPTMTVDPSKMRSVLTYQVECIECRAITGIHGSGRAAAHAWNTRMGGK